MAAKVGPAQQHQWFHQHGPVDPHCCWCKEVATNAQDTEAMLSNIADALGVEIWATAEQLAEAAANIRKQARREALDAAATMIERRFQDLVGWQPGESRNQLVCDIASKVRELPDGYRGKLADAEQEE